MATGRSTHRRGGPSAETNGPAVAGRLHGLHVAASCLTHPKGKARLPESTVGRIEISRALALRQGLAARPRRPRPPLYPGARFRREKEFQLGFHGLVQTSVTREELRIEESRVAARSRFAIELAAENHPALLVGGMENALQAGPASISGGEPTRSLPRSEARGGNRGDDTTQKMRNRCMPKCRPAICPIPDEKAT